jgi:1-acyl-sn-glycerol-3-phosphate acyltransferase
MIETAAQALSEGQSLIVFPEGTRTRPGQPLTFHRGASYLAIRAAKTLTPVYIRCVPTTLTKAEPWYHIPPRPIRFTLQVGDDFDLAPYQVMRSVPMASRALNEHLRAQFQRELQHADEIY